MPHVRSVSIGVWLTRGSRHEPRVHEGIAHFVEHMLFKGTDTRSAEDLAQQIDSIGGHLDAFTSKEYAGYFIKVLDEHLPLAVDVLSDLVTSPAFDADRDRAREEGRPRRDQDGRGHARRPRARDLRRRHLARPSARPADSRRARHRLGARSRGAARATSQDAYVAPNFIVAAVGNLEHERVRDLVSAAFARAGATGTPIARDGAGHRRRGDRAHQGSRAEPRVPRRGRGCRTATPIATWRYALNTMLGGSMSSRLFQNVREKRGLAYAVFSSLSTYRDTGAVTIYAGCANDAVRELVDVVMAELRRLEGRSAGARRTAARQGPPEGQPDAGPREHVEPDDTPGAPGDLRRYRRVARRHAHGHRRGQRAPTSRGSRSGCFPPAP